ncbi:MAG TPA: tRNA (adenosine(37)-N6)-threonylcarbamoyltransferase complex dimerization subunit type 1 TsaB [Solirubrobacterales bacterium]|nr:tRNA (adenosine(37)-N6)-threonylcarbamoyltransferase complex dimerization subunit type 1 TsaB [Solirubrobacterales bacterium]
MTHDGRRHAILAIDTATTQVVIATGSANGTADGISTWAAGYRHGETLLPSIGRFLGEQNIRRSRLVGVVVGTGPGAFTGLRVGMATAKGLAHGLGIPLAGVSTGEALLEASGVDRPVLLLPAGPSDRLVLRPGVAAQPLAKGDEPTVEADETLVALDLPDRAPADALERGEVARRGLGAALIRLGAARLADLAAQEPASGAQAHELETLVPDYVTLPRGVQAVGDGVAWSRDHR